MLERFSAAHIAVSQPFLSRSWAKMVENWFFGMQTGHFLAFHDIKPVLATGKPTENGFKAPCCGSSAIVVVPR